VHEEVDLEEGDMVGEIRVGYLGEWEELGEVGVRSWEVGTGSADRLATMMMKRA